jgi:hypothetical protein
MTLISVAEANDFRARGWPIISKIKGESNAYVVVFLRFASGVHLAWRPVRRTVAADQPARQPIAFLEDTAVLTGTAPGRYRSR